METGDQITHQVSLEESDSYSAEISLDIFREDPNYQENEKQYEVRALCKSFNHRISCRLVFGA